MEDHEVIILPYEMTAHQLMNVLMKVPDNTRIEFSESDQRRVDNEKPFAHTKVKYYRAYHTLQMVRFVWKM